MFALFTVSAAVARVKTGSDTHMLLQKLFNNDAKSNAGVCVPSVRLFAIAVQLLCTRGSLK